MIDFIESLFYGNNGWSGGIAHSIIIISIVIALGRVLSKIKIKNIGLGGTWILFVGIAFGHFGMSLDTNLLHFMKEFGLILFVYSIGLQVGPSLFSSLKSGGGQKNLLAIFIVVCAVVVTIILQHITGEDITTMTGVMSGAVTNTPGMGAAQQAYTDITGKVAPEIALGYAVAYPLGLIGCILGFAVIKALFYRNSPLQTPAPHTQETVENPAQIKDERPAGGKYISRRIIISKRRLNGLALNKLDFKRVLGVTVTRIRRSGIEIIPTPNFRLMYGDQVTVTGTEEGIAAIERVLGNSRKRLDEPNLVPIFVGITLGCILGSIPIYIPGIPQAIKLGLAGGPLIVSLLMANFGPKFKVVTYTTASANLMLREIGISLFLASVGIEAGGNFISTIINGGLVWIPYGVIITIVPILLAGLIGRYILKLDYVTLIGVISGACTNPPALGYASELDKDSNSAAIGYATVYPLSMFCRVLAAQILIIFLL